MFRLRLTNLRMMRPGAGGLPHDALRFGGNPDLLHSLSKPARGLIIQIAFVYQSDQINGNFNKNVCAIQFLGRPIWYPWWEGQLVAQECDKRTYDARRVVWRFGFIADVTRAALFQFCPARVRNDWRSGCDCPIAIRWRIDSPLALHENSSCSRTTFANEEGQLVSCDTRHEFMIHNFRPRVQNSQLGAEKTYRFAKVDYLPSECKSVKIVRNLLGNARAI